ncbi:Uncharacterised protein [Mycobacteroides abscessus subsp. abscessus]|nr:Uncharacterised protein [Mycobacteroides abscessus subsp. abscessus]
MINSAAYSTSTCADSTSTPMPGYSPLIFWAASNPSVVWVGGIRISTTTRSGLSVRTSSSSAVASPARPTTSKPAFSRTLATPSRSNVSSSATRTRIADISPGYRRRADSRSASAPILLIGERAARRFTGSE